MNDDSITKIKKILEDHKLTDINILDLTGKSPFFDAFVIATSNPRQAQAVESAIKQEFKSAIRQSSITDSWTLIDLGGVIVHLFNEESRKYYKLDNIHI